MKSNLILMASAAVILMTNLPQAFAQSGQPMQLQPQQPPVVSTQEPETRASLGASGTMWADEAAAKAAAAQAPAAGEPADVAPKFTDKAGVLTSVPTPPAPVATVPAKPVKTVGGAQMLPTKTIIENVVNSKDHTTLVKVIKTAGLESTLSSPGPFTVFAPTNRAFAKIPAKAMAELMKPESREKLVKLLNYHVVAGAHDAASIMADIKAGNGTATYSTVAGSDLKATVRKGVITLTDENGNRSRVTTADVFQSNGVVHVVDTVVIPK